MTLHGALLQAVSLLIKTRVGFALFVVVSMGFNVESPLTFLPGPFGEDVICHKAADKCFRISHLVLSHMLSLKQHPRYSTLWPLTLLPEEGNVRRILPFSASISEWQLKRQWHKMLQCGNLSVLMAIFDVSFIFEIKDLLSNVNTNDNRRTGQSSMELWEWKKILFLRMKLCV